MLARSPELGWPSDMYLEGSDQHRGWFQSSLLVALATRGRPPFREVLTHGFLIDLEGRKMSKSLGNVIAPQDVIKESGAEIIRLWVAMTEFTEELRVSKEILTRVVDVYRKLRNTCRILVANLYDFDPATDMVPVDALDAVDRFALARYAEAAQRMLRAYDEYDFSTVSQTLNTLATVDLSAFYVDVTKDRMYTLGAKSHERRSTQTVMYLDLATDWRACWRRSCRSPPTSCGGTCPAARAESVHLEEFPKVEAYSDAPLLETWERAARRARDGQRRARGEAQGQGHRHFARRARRRSPRRARSARCSKSHRDDLPMLFNRLGRRAARRRDRRRRRGARRGREGAGREVRAVLALRARACEPSRTGRASATAASTRSPGSSTADVASVRHALLVWVIALVVVARSGREGAGPPRLELYESITVIPGFFSLTRVHNTGAAFGLLNSIDFPFKAAVLALLQTAALVGLTVYAAMLAHEQRLTRVGLAFVIGGAAGNLIDRVMFGYVLDFVDFYWGGWHFWAFNVADAAITIGVALMILDMLGVGRLIVYPELFSLGPVTVYSYGVLLAASYLLGLRLAMSRAKKWGLDSNRVLDLGIYIIIAALVGAKLLLLVVDFDQFRRSPADLLSLVRSGGVFYGGLLLAVAVAFWYIARHRMPFWTTCDVFAPAIALGHVTAGSGAWPPAAATASRRTCRGRSSSRTRWPRPTSARRSASRCTRRSSTRPARSC